jgi:putative addiction module component (TIGR02574 family)
MKLADFPDVYDLPLREKLKLVDELWLSMASELDSLEVSQQEKELLDERWAAFLKDPNSAITLTEFQRRMKALRYDSTPSPPGGF